MKKLYTLLSVILFTVNLLSQAPPNSWFAGITATNCPFDSSVTINQTEYWMVYQTQNGKWNGEIDSTRCISLEEVDNDLEIDLTQIDPSKPLFVKSLMDDDTKILLEPNTLYNTSFHFRKSDVTLLNLNEDCANGLCSGLIVGIEIPDSTGLDTALRMHSTTATQNSFSDASTCIATEKFDENYLKEFILKVTLTNQTVDDQWLRLRRVYNTHLGWWDDYQVYDMPIPENLYNGSSYNAYLTDFSVEGGNALLMYGETTYPSPEHLSYVEAHLVQNKPTQETININLLEYENLVYQPFTELRGGLIQGDDSVRHIVNLNNWGGTICMEPIIDFAFNGPTHYVHHDGYVEFHGKTSCMIFKNGATLNVAENATFHYGNGGEGMLAICDGSTINIAKNGILVIDNHMILKSNGNKENQQVFMELNPGSTLQFAENAKLSHIGLYPEMRLNIYMNGGVLDDHLLTESERQLINRIYPEPDEQNIFTVSPNPISENCMVSMIAKNEGDISFQIIDMNGRMVQSYQKSIEKGYNEFGLNLNGYSSGMYLFKLESSEMSACQKLIKL